MSPATSQLWIDQWECLEIIGADDDLSEIALRMARLLHEGQLDRFTAAVSLDPELRPGTRDWVLALAGNEQFLLAAELVLTRSRDVN